MAEAGQPKFEHSALEKEIVRLSQEVQEHKERLGMEEADRKAVGEALRGRVYAEPKASAGAGGSVQPASPVLPVYLQKESPEIKLKVEQLLDEAFHRGIDKTAEEARKYGPFILDAFHDALTTKLYKELKNRNLL